MICFLGWFHEWEWPRRRGRVDVQVCARCGAERVAKVRFGKEGKTNGETQG